MNNWKAKKTKFYLENNKSYAIDTSGDILEATISQLRLLNVKQDIIR